MSKERIINAIAIFILPIVLFLVSPFWTELFASKKSLEYSVISKRTIGGVSFEKESWPEIKIVYRDQVVSNGTFLVVSIENNSKIPIKRDDFEGPIQIEVSNPKVLISHRVTKRLPDDLPVHVTSNDKGIQIQPMLLNSGDGFQIELLATEDFSVSRVSARIVGVESVKEKKLDERSGIYLNEVKSIGPGITQERYIIRVPAIIPVIGIFLMVASSVVFYGLRRQAKSKASKYGIGLFAGANYFFSVFGGIILIYILRSDGLSKLAQLTIVFSVLIVSAGLGVILYRIWFKPKKVYMTE